MLALALFYKNSQYKNFGQKMPYQLNRFNNNFIINNNFIPVMLIFVYQVTNFNKNNNII